MPNSNPPNERAGMVERDKVVDWLRSHEGQHERAVAVGECLPYSIRYSALGTQAAYYREAADAIERGDHLTALSEGSE